MAAVVPIPPGVEAETSALSHDSSFSEIINRSWKGYQKNGGIPLEEARRKYGIRRKPARKAGRRSR